jgi:hypothetical protein
VEVSSTEVLAANCIVQLSFSGPLDVQVATDPGHYMVTVNNQRVTVESATYSTSTNTVTLGLPEATLQSGASVTVSWQGLRDLQGRLMDDGQMGLIIAQ